MNPFATVIIPCRNHGQYLAGAIDSALAQVIVQPDGHQIPVPMEVIVVDDGSQDDTSEVLDRYEGRVLRLWQKHRGVAAARNLGLLRATSDFVSFLDADDVIYPGKIATQIAAFAQWPIADWILCDVLIIDEISNQIETASKRYDYKRKGLPGRTELGPLLATGNFIPVHSPLIRRTALAGLEFPEGKLEDWAFWRALAAAAPARYVPDVLCEYHKRKTGRNSAK